MKALAESKEALGSTLAVMRGMGQAANKPHVIEAQEKKALCIFGLRCQQWERMVHRKAGGVRSPLQDSGVIPDMPLW